MMGAGAGHEHSAGPDEVEPQFIDAGIRFKALTRVLLALDEGRRIEADDVEGAALAPEIRKQGKGVALKGFHFGSCGFAVFPGVGKSLGGGV